ncbi:MAG: sigma-70 family RNA polymerase sigma factor, partial [Chloroflexota bacterium]
MSSKSDHELIGEMREGRRGALGDLFDRYSPTLYEFIYRIIGDRDQTARLLEETFARVPAGVPALDDQVPVRGWLYGLAREVSLGFLRQKAWLDSLPPSSEPSVSGLAGDIWRAARAIPAFHRAVLVVEELHGLSPTEKAHALGIARTDFTRLLEEARRLFNAQFDSQARGQNRPVSSQIDPEHIWGMHRRLGSGGSLFGYLPAFVLPDSLAATVRARVLSSARMLAAAPHIAESVLVESVPAETPPRAPLLPEAGSLFDGCAWQWIGTAFLVALVIIAIALGIGFLVTRDTAAPVISRVEPTGDSTIPYNPSP